MAIDSTGIESQIDSNLPDNNQRQNKAYVVRALLKIVVRWVRDTANQLLLINSFKPAHRWSGGSKLALQNPDGTWSIPVDLRGWTPILAAIQDGNRTVFQVIDWSGGEGDKPAVGQFIGSIGLVANAASAVDVRGTAGATGWSPSLTLVPDGNRRVFQVADWIGGTGGKPTSGVLYVGSAGLVSSLAAAVDVRGGIGLTGAEGKRGSTWTYGASAPVNGSGNQGDMFLRSTTWDVYQLPTDGGNWALLGNIKGTAGTNGTNGTNGLNAASQLTAAFTQPAVNASVAITVSSTHWMGIGSIIFVTHPSQGGSYYSVANVSSATAATITNLGYAGPAAGVSFAASVAVVPAGIQGAKGADGTNGTNGTSTPTGAAGGVLSGNYPNPSITTQAAIDIATRPEAYQRWHDILAFGRHTGWPTLERRINGTWTANALTIDEKKPFAQKETDSVDAVPANNTTYTGARYTWSSGALGYSGVSFIAVSYAYVGFAHTYGVTVESGTDGTNWTSRATHSTGSSAETFFIPITNWGGDTRLRITFQSTGDGTTNQLRLVSLQALAVRKGDQGGGIDYETPFIWDADRKITVADLRIAKSGAANGKVLTAMDNEGNVEWRDATGGTGGGATGPAGPAGTNGTNGTNGVDGVSAYATSTASYVQPAYYVLGNGAASVTVNVNTNVWMAVGQILYGFNVSTGSIVGYYRVSGKNGTTQVYLNALDYRAEMGATGTTPGATVNGTVYLVPAGLKGNTPTFSLGTVTTGAAGSSASVTVDNTNAPAYVLNFTIPRGAAGADGAAGTTGNSGTAGANGKSVLSGSGSPSNGTGVDGDFYINTSAWTIQGPKASGAWPAAKSLIGPQGPAGADGTGGGGSSVGSFFETVTPTTVAQLNTAIANCTKPVLYVIGSALAMTEMVVINNRSNLRIMAHNMELTLNNWNSGVQGIMFDLQGTIKNVKIEGFRFNCPLPSSSGNGDGGGYGMIIARGAIVASIDGLTIENCHFTTPNLHMNAISLICVGWGGTSTIQNVLVKNCTAESVKRMFFECTNQQAESNGKFMTNGTIRYRNISVIGCNARNLGGNGVNTSGGMMVSFDGPGDNILVQDNNVVNPYFAAYEAVGVNNVRMLNNNADYEPGYTANFVGYSFTDGQHGTDFGPTRVKVEGGRVRCTGRSFNLTNGGNHSFENVAFESKDGNTIVNSSGNEFRKCSIVGKATNSYLIALQQTSQMNVLADCYLGNERSNDGSGGRCNIVMFDGACINNRFLYLNHYQEKRTTNNDWYEPTILDFSSNKASNEVLYNRTNNPALSN